MKKNKNKLILGIAIFFIIIIGVLLAFAGRLTPNDEFETGNTAGNLNNKGLFCEQDGIVYFSNAYDNNVLYSMSPDESNVKRLNNVSVASLNADPKRIF